MLYYSYKEGNSNVPTIKLMLYCSFRHFNFCSDCYTGAIAIHNGITERVWPVHITDLNCTGSEEQFLQCSHNALEAGSCNRRNDVSVVCQPIEGTVMSLYERRCHFMQRWLCSWRRELLLRRTKDWDSSKRNKREAWVLWQPSVVLFSKVNPLDFHQLQERSSGLSAFGVQ